jgi:hypothetical protein
MCDEISARLDVLQINLTRGRRYRGNDLDCLSGPDQHSTGYSQPFTEGRPRA